MFLFSCLANFHFSFPLPFAEQKHILMSDIQSVIQMAQDAGVEFIDLKFVGLLGDLQHLTYPVESALNEDFFTDGVGFDGSSVRGFQTIDKSDMLLMPDAATAIIDPAHDTPTLSVFANILDPITGESYSRDPRYIVQKAVEYMKSTGIADTAYFGPEAEFFLFNGVSFGGQRAPGGIDGQYAHYKVDSTEGDWHNEDAPFDEMTGEWNSGRRPAQQGRLRPGTSGGFSGRSAQRHRAPSHRRGH